MKIKTTVERQAFGLLIDKFLSQVDRDELDTSTILKIIDFTQRNIGDKFEGSEKAFDSAREMLKNPENKWTKLIISTLKNTHPNVRKQIIMNLGFQSMIIENKDLPKKKLEFGTQIPWTILFDPTSDCNKKCIGCWAAKYGHKLNLTYDIMNKIVTQGKELGIYFYMMTGGEPLIRKDDIIRLAEEHSECYFNIFSNGSLIDEKLCSELQRVGNITFSLSVEGFESDNDFRRGKGSFVEVSHAMDLLKSYGIPYGSSLVYTSKNYRTITSDEFLDFLVSKGSVFAWYFHYMPVGKGANTELLLTPEQREYVFWRIKEIRAFNSGKPIFTMDFQNDGPTMDGCIAGGRNYFHINSNGDAEPCVFIHYSDSNIKNMDLIDILKAPLFSTYREGQPFNKNHLMPCPMLENPYELKKILSKTSANSTDFESKETPEELQAKTIPYAKNWKETANNLWNKYYINKVHSPQYKSDK